MNFFSLIYNLFWLRVLKYISDVISDNDWSWFLGVCLILRIIDTKIKTMFILFRWWPHIWLVWIIYM